MIARSRSRAAETCRGACRSRFRGSTLQRLKTVRFSLLRGVCQTPAYVAHENGYFSEEGVRSELEIEPTAWMVPRKLDAGQSKFAVMPWTRVAAAQAGEVPLVAVAGSGHEEAAIVVRAGIDSSQVRRVTVPLRGGMKDLTAMALLESLGWRDVEVRRQPSGDGAIISLFGGGCDAASMVEPYATMMEALGVGVVVRRTGDVWPGAPGCSLATTSRLTRSEPELVAAVVRAFSRGARFARDHPGQTAEIAAPYIGVNERHIEAALARNAPDVEALGNDDAVDRVLSLMVELGYLDSAPTGFRDLSFLDRVTSPA
jgi:NitT/TauT family transport system substrate-binding protein